MSETNTKKKNAIKDKDVRKRKKKGTNKKVKKKTKEIEKLKKKKVYLCLLKLKEIQSAIREHMEIESKILHISKGSEIANHTETLMNHFQKQGSFWFHLFRFGFSSSFLFLSSFFSCS